MLDNERSDWMLTPQTIVGAAVVVVGLLLMAGNLGWVEPHSIFFYWPLGLVAGGAALLSRASDQNAKTTAWAVIAVGAYLSVARVVGFRADLSDLWPLFVIGVGVTMLMRARRREQSPAAVGDHVVHDFAFWSGVQRRITSPAFKRADFTVVMGGIEVDLRGAATTDEPAVIDVFVVWGGLEIRVPPDWTVSNQIVAILGGASDKTTGEKNGRHRLILRGVVLMGGVEIKV